MDETPERIGQGMQQPDANEESEGIHDSDQSVEGSSDSSGDELLIGTDEQELQQIEAAVIEEAEGMDVELETNDSDESEESEGSSGSTDTDELEELILPPPLPPPSSIVDDVRAYLPPLRSASLIAERPPVQLIPCDRRTDWSILPTEALDNIYMHLPVSDIHVMGNVFDENLNTEWNQRWLEEALDLHDSQIHYATYKDVKYYIRKHSGVINSFRIDKLVFTSDNVSSWCRQLRKPEVTGPSEIILVNRGTPSKPLCLEPVPEEILLPFNGGKLKKLHLCFFTLPRGGLHTFIALSAICELGLHGCACDDDELANGISMWLNLERLILSFASQTLLRVVSHSIRELKVHKSSIRFLDLRGASTLIQLSELDFDSMDIKLDHLYIPSLIVLDVIVNYTKLPENSQVRMLRVLLNSFPCIQDLTIKRKDTASEGQMLQGDEYLCNLFDGMECSVEHLKVATFVDFQAGKFEFALIKALVSRAKNLSMVKVVCHTTCLEGIRVETTAILKEICNISLTLNFSIS